MSNSKVQTYQTNQGADIYQLPVEVFPKFRANVFLVHIDGNWILIDTGSGFFHSNEDLDDGFKWVSDRMGRSIGYKDLEYILITHSHIDHFGGLPYILQQSEAQVVVHELDLRNLTNIDERLILVSRRLEQFLAESGVDDEFRERLVQVHKMSKLDYSSIDVAVTYSQADLAIKGLKTLHVPGHCPGQVVIQLHDVLFSADHVLSHTTPHQAPERITLHTGLSHYLDSLQALDDWADGIAISLGGHEEPILDLHGRIKEIRSAHQRRLNKIYDLVDRPMMVSEISAGIFKNIDGYDQLLALEEAGAHVEYLYQRGQFGIANIDEIDRSLGTIPWKFCRLSS